MKVRLEVYRNNPYITGVTSSSTSGTNITPITITTSGSDATTTLSVGEVLINASNQVYGIIKQINSATSIDLHSLNTPLTASDAFYIAKEDTYQLDFQEQPNVSLNFQFADIKEPEKRKGSFSQTFKLPFTDNNNNFFQNWFNVNLSTLEFSTKKRFNANLSVGGLTQFDGFIQLKAVYQKAQLYEVVLMSNTADLFTAIGSKKLRDLFLDENNIPTRELNHNFNYANIGYSWDGSSSSFLDVFDVSLRDSVGGVQKVMYPMSISVPKFWYESSDSNRYLAMNDIAAQGENAEQYMVPISQLKPAIQLRTLLDLIFAKAGFYLKSTFLGSAYFRKLFMTTCNHTGRPFPTVSSSAGAVDGQCTIGNSTSFKTYVFAADQDIGCSNMAVSDPGWGSLTNYTSWILIPADSTTPSSGYTIPQDNYGLWSTATNSFKRDDINMTSMNVRFNVSRSNIKQCGDGIEMQFKVRTLGGSDLQTVTQLIGNQTSASGNFWVDVDLDITNVPVGERCQIYCRPYSFKKDNDSNTAQLLLGNLDLQNTDLRVKLEVKWLGLGDGVYDKEVDILNCIDPEITQKSFLKDLISRFNLVVIPDPDNPSGVIVEPYNDFIASGDLKHWTDKIDLSKEIIVKDATSLQKQRINLTDLEDVDLWNKSIKEDAPDLNVFGNVNILNTQNQFANGEMKSSSIFSPYINEKVFRGNNENWVSAIPNMAVQYEYTYKRVGQGSYEDAFEATKPKIYYYSGSKTPVTDYVDNYYLHSFNSEGTVVYYQFNDYPLCSPYDLDASSGSSTITINTKSLYWSQQPPPAGELLVFNSNPGLVIGQSLYYEYWQTYFNQIYNEDTRIMECYLNLNEVDIHNLNFGDEIFIKDTYWRVLNINNYQVGVVSSTKVTLIKVPEIFLETCHNCDQVVATNLAGGPSLVNGYFAWCPEDDPDCNPMLLSGYQYLSTTGACCECNGGEWEALIWAGQPGVYENWTPGTGTCLANTGSLPIQKKELYNRPRAVLSKGNLRDIIENKLNGRGKPLMIGTDTDKFTKSILTHMGDDFKIKYKNYNRTTPSLAGESHRFVLMGYTEGTTIGYAYINGQPTAPKVRMPSSSIVNLRIKAIATVVGGTSTTYPLGNTEIVAYSLGFRQTDGETVTLIGTRGGDLEYALTEAGKTTSCSLFVLCETDNVIEFGLKDTQADTKRVWQLEVELDINEVPNMSIPFDTKWALYQNLVYIELQNGEYLVWN